MGRPLGTARSATDWGLQPRYAASLTTTDTRILRLLENVAVCLWGATSRFRHSEELDRHRSMDAQGSSEPQHRHVLSSVLMARDNWYTVLWHMAHFPGVVDGPQAADGDGNGANGQRGRDTALLGSGYDGVMVRSCAMGILSSAVR